MTVAYVKLHWFGNCTPQEFERERAGNELRPTGLVPKVHSIHMLTQKMKHSHQILTYPVFSLLLPLIDAMRRFAKRTRTRQLHSSGNCGLLQNCTPQLTVAADMQLQGAVCSSMNHGRTAMC